MKKQTTIAYLLDVDDNHAHKWVSYFAANNYRVLLICEEGRTAPMYKNDNVTLLPVLPKTFPLRNIFAKQKAVRTLKKILHDYEVDVLHCIYVVPNAFWGYLSGFKNYIVTTFGSDVLVEYPAYSGRGSFSQRYTNSRLKAVFEESIREAVFLTSTSIRQREVLDKITHTENKHIIRTGVYADQFIHLWEQTPVPEKTDWVILSNRAMRPLYNIDIIVNAFALLVQRHPQHPFRLELINHHTDETYLEEIKTLLHELHLDKKVIIHPAQNLPGLVSCYKNADVVVMIPSSDGTPVSGSEVMLAHRPLVIGPLRYDEDIFTTETCWQTADFTPEALADTLYAIYTTDAQHVKAVTDKAFAASYAGADYEKEVRRIEGLYLGMVKNN